MLADNNPHLLRIENNVVQKEVSDWTRRYFEAQDEIKTLSREVEELSGMTPERRRHLQQLSENQLKTARAEAEKIREQASSRAKTLEELYNAQKDELETNI